MVSYADFVTLLFAFFVVMFASANSDSAKVDAVSESVKSALQEGSVAQVAHLVSEALNGSKNPNAKPQKEQRYAQPVMDLESSMKLLKEQLKAEIQAGKIELHLEARGLAISFTQAALFPSGEDVIDPAAFPSIGKVANAILLVPNPVRLEGHTDNVPIHNQRFKSNWELSSSRSIAVLELMMSRFNVPKERLSVGGYADIAPISSNNEEPGRARNRRVDIVILSQIGEKGEPDRQLRKPSA